MGHREPPARRRPQPGALLRGRGRGDRQLTPDGDAEASEEALVAAFVAGDRAAFDALVRRCSPRVYGLCLRYFRDPQEAEDAAQETFLTVFRRAHTFAGTASFSTWLYRVTTNTCNDLARRRRRRPRTVDLDADGQAADRVTDRTVEDALAARELADELRRALQRLDAPQREAVVLHDVLGWPLADIAERTGVALGTVKSRIHRGHARLLQLLDTPEPTPAPRPPTVHP